MTHIHENVVIRRPESSEYDSVQALVQTVVDETYGGVWTDPPIPIGQEDWSRACVAVCGASIVGVVLTQEEWLDDLWVHRDYRRAGIGQRLLSLAEREIAARGYSAARLRVVASNQDAIRFYQRSGWSAQRSFPHESFPIEMTEMQKQLDGI
jgi:ribosomal protein S18 acetylase RimI-like enzyme